MSGEQAATGGISANGCSTRNLPFTGRRSERLRRVADSTGRRRADLAADASLTSTNGHFSTLALPTGLSTLKYDARPPAVPDG